MPRYSTDLVPFIPAIDAAREAMAGKTIGGSELARSIGMTWRVLRAFIERDKDFPVISAGSDGIRWSFDADAALAHLLTRATAMANERKSDTATSARLGGHDAVGEDQEAHAAYGDMSTPDRAEDLARNARAMKALAESQMLIHRLKREQGGYVAADAVRDLLNEIMMTVQVETLAVATKLDPSGSWQPELRISVETELKNVLLTVRRKLDVKLKKLSGHKP